MEEINWSQFIKTLREEKQISKYRLAKILGVSWNTIYLWERGVFKPKKIYQKKLEELNATKNR